ncbi:MAG: flagellar basal body rod protein FlgB [Desulfobulbaceae bacterium]|nr:MAG: flagellar basal body rod protein FlgB [Desulfobulbaceae bacterium]
MPINKMFEGSIAVMHQALNLRGERQGLIQSNIANLETPGYKAQDFDFERVMAQVVARQGQGQEQMVRTHARHIGADSTELARASQFSHERRPVNLDEEMLKLAENQLMYQVTSQLIAGSFRGLRHVIDEGAK